MSVLSNYFTTAYISRLEELKSKITDLCASDLTDDQCSPMFQKIYNQFISTTSMHIRGFESQKINTSNSDDKYIKFCRKDWLIDYLSGKNEVSEILEA